MHGYGFEREAIFCECNFGHKAVDRCDEMSDLLNQYRLFQLIRLCVDVLPGFRILTHIAGKGTGSQ